MKLRYKTIIDINKIPVEQLIKAVIDGINKISNSLDKLKDEVNQNLNPDYEINSIRAKYKIKSWKYTQKAIAEALGISQSYVGHILNGRRKCPAKLQAKLQKYLNQ